MVSVYVVAFMLVGIYIAVRIYSKRLMLENEERLRQNNRLSLVLRSGRLRVWIYLPSTRHYYYLSEEDTFECEYNPVEFSELFNRDDFEQLRKMVFDICENKREKADVLLRSIEHPDGSVSYYETRISVGKRDRHGDVTCVVGMQRDVTEEQVKMRHVNELMIRYQTVFNTSLVDMIYFDANYVLRDVNDKACQTFNVKDREAVKSGKLRLQDNPLFNTVLTEHMENTRSSAWADKKILKGEFYEVDNSDSDGKMYYESTINPIHNEKGELEGFYMAGRDITEMVDSYHYLQDGIRLLNLATRNIEEYVNNINYALHVTNVQLVNYYPQSYTLEVSRNVREGQLRLSQLRCIRLATMRFRRTVSSVLNRMDHLSPYNISETIETEIRDKKGRQIWLQFNMVPMRGADGEIVRYFGMCRNMTDMIETERRLAVETKKAQETEVLKQAFLTNMSYEIRTPLNTVVGFAELFEAEHDPADEPLFVEEIKKNSSVLLNLVNDILFLSRLDANMIEYNKAPVDFALVFESHCQMGWSSNPLLSVKTSVENPYEHLVVDIDQPNLGRVIEKLCANAVNYTHEGYVRAKYEYRGEQLIISIEDSGIGIPADMQTKIFDRFARDHNEQHFGTGLDLPIVQMLVQQMGGTIELQSEEGKGTTIWVTMPCKATVMEKKREILS